MIDYLALFLAMAITMQLNVTINDNMFLKTKMDPYRGPCIYLHSKHQF